MLCKSWEDYITYSTGGLGPLMIHTYFQLLIQDLVGFCLLAQKLESCGGKPSADITQLRHHHVVPAIY